MSRLYLLIFSFLLFGSCTKYVGDNPPNIIYILADDLGYGELGIYGQEKIETPNIDKLATNGMVFTDHYSGSPVCAPSRCVLLTGMHSGHAYIRGNDEWASRGDVWNYHEVIKDPRLEGQRPIPDSIITVAELLKTAGYRTGIIGKWGLGAPGTEGVPGKQGFDYFFGYNCQRQAHTYNPVHLWKNDERVILSNDTVAPGAELAPGVDAYDINNYSDFWQKDYSPDLMFDQIQSFIDSDSEKPFFLYWATPIPHVALQAPPEWVDYYVEKFGDEEPYTGSKGYFPNRYPRACYAAMISYLDNQVGMLVKQLKDKGILENTLIIFTSDNGPSYAGGTDPLWFNSAGRFREEYGYAKGFVREGGIRVPMIASWPGMIKKGSVTDHISAFYDVLPTLCDIAGIKAPSGIDGISFYPTLIGESRQDEHDYLYWEFPSYNGQQAVRMGRWKAVRRDIFDGNMDIKLYDLDNEPFEEIDLADKFPDIVSRMEEIMQEAHTSSALEKFRIKELGDN